MRPCAMLVRRVDSKGLKPMATTRRVIMTLSMVAFVVLLGGDLRAGDETLESLPAGPVEKAPLPQLDLGCKCSSMSACWCADNYRPKCLPAICPPAYCGGCDCYCAKCPPVICPPSYCGTCDCYQAKCAPCVKKPWRFPSFYKCPPADCGILPTAKVPVGK